MLAAGTQCRCFMIKRWWRVLQCPYRTKHNVSLVDVSGLFRDGTFFIYFIRLWIEVSAEQTSKLFELSWRILRRC